MHTDILKDFFPDIEFGESHYQKVILKISNSSTI